MSPLASALVTVLVHLAPSAPPFVVDELDVQGVVQRPTAVTVVTAPGAVGLRDPPSPALVAQAEERLARGPATAADLFVRARARADEARARLEADLAAWDVALACAARGACPEPGEPPVADYRPALVALAEAEGPPDAAEQRIDRLSFAAALALEPGPGYDPARAMVALSEVARHIERGPVAIWARFIMGEHAFEQGDMAGALGHYRAGAKADPGSSLVPFLRYKSAWAHFNLDDADQAIAVFRAIADGATSPIASEAARDLVVAYAQRPGRVDEALGVLSARADGVRLLLALAEAMSYQDERAAVARVVEALSDRTLDHDDARRLALLRSWLAPGGPAGR